MSVLPDELWITIMEAGIESKTLEYKDLCSLSVACSRFRRLASEDSLWSFLLRSDFSSSTDDSKKEKESTSSSILSGKFKSLYKIRYKDRERKRLARRIVILRMQSELAERLRKIRDVQFQSSEGKEKTNMMADEKMNLGKAREGSIAVNFRQGNVPIESRINALEMEINRCKEQIAGVDMDIHVEKQRLHEIRKRLASVKYHRKC
ncbi:F-box protein SKIP24-like [Andrographis paniculata]|uniref:F-box protein SKIP24-like n=1 Tax=Andrographis paniculata TaxID=175694 RepID=UPI0021E8077C|nr:F-box protein SKIP24-like [Andrographis paniculata]XP_051138959.1 F-box protein SKIP24-like [Andrographis paniculata]